MPTSRSRRGIGSRRKAPLSAVLLIVLAMLAAFAVGVSAAPPEGGEEEAGNSLSYPVVWSDGGDAKLPLVGTFDDPSFEGVYLDNVPDDPATKDLDESEYRWYLQGDPLNLWQAESLDAAAAGIDGVDVTSVDWGDNLEAKSWQTDGRVRVETVLYQDVANDPEFADADGMLGFVMTSLGGQHRDEIWGTNRDTYQSPRAAVYSGSARLTIQRLEVSRDDPNLPLMKWDATKGQWTGENLVEAPIFNGGAWEGGEGSGFSAEINGSGKVIYGYNWDTGGLDDGHYRITFSLDAANGPEPLNAAITEDTGIEISEEEGAAEATAEEPDMGGGVARIDGDNSLSYIDVQLGDPTYGPYVPPVVDTPTPTPTPTASPTPSGAPDQTPPPQVQQRKHVRMTLHARVLGRHRVRFSGSVRPRHDGKKVRIQRRVGDRYRTVAKVRLRKATTTRSQYRLTLRNAKAGRYRLYMPADVEHLATTSAVVRVRLP